MKIVAIIQARVGSTRLPNKVFYKLADKPLIWHVVNRLRKSTKLTDIVLATTQNALDDDLANWAIENGVNLFRGSELNVLDRYYSAAKYCKADLIVRITADDPFKDPFIMDSVIDMVCTNTIDFGFNNKPPSFPEGMDIEVFTFQALHEAHLNSRDLFEQEHVTQYFHRNQEKFLMKNYSLESDYSYLRWTIDTHTDYVMACQVYNNLYISGKVFLFHEILELLKEKPEIALINCNVERSLMYNKLI